MTNSRLLGAVLAAGLLVAACGGGGGATSPGATTGTQTSPRATSPGATTGAATTAPSTAGTGATTAPAGDDAAIVQLAESDLGQILVDAEGMVLYGFVPDEEEGEPTCYDDCAEAWPPLLVEDDDDDDFTVGEGLDEADFSTAERTDDGTQLKIGTYPLYYFANDEAPGDTNGQGLNDVWLVVGADGELIRDTE